MATWTLRGDVEDAAQGAAGDDHPRRRAVDGQAFADEDVALQEDDARGARRRSDRTRRRRRAALARRPRAGCRCRCCALVVTMSGCASTAPMSELSPPAHRRDAGDVERTVSARAGRSKMPALLPWSIAGLPGSGMCVCVGPPLYCSGPSCGSVSVWSVSSAEEAAAVVAGQVEAERRDRGRTADRGGSPTFAPVLSATMELRSVMVADRPAARLQANAAAIRAVLFGDRTVGDGQASGRRRG